MSGNRSCLLCGRRTEHIDPDSGYCLPCLYSPTEKERA